MSKHKRYSGNGAVTRPTRGKGSADAKAETLRRREARRVKYSPQLLPSSSLSVS